MVSLEPLDLSRLMSQKKVEVIANYWVYLPPAANRAAADKRLAELKASGIRDVSVIDAGPQRNAISLGVFRGEDAARSRLASLQVQGLTNAKLEPRTQSVQQTVLVVRDPSAQAIARIKELQSEFPGSDTKIGSCDKQA
ncbi:MAG: SPOR domain-containing protein, partial [Casimicrobiaceae bacterium]